MTLIEFKKRFNALRKRGFVRSIRRGPTGVGYTLESLLGLKENNLAVPDLGEVELKARRENATNLVTLFTFNRKAWVMNPLEAVRKYGTLDANGRRGMYFTMSTKPNSSGLFIEVTDECVWVQHTSGQIVVKWDMTALAEQFRKKVPALVMVTAHTEERAGIEYFHYYRAQLLSGASQHVLADQLRYGNMLIDLRLHDKGTMARNHGTGFRAPEARRVQSWLTGGNN